MDRIDIGSCCVYCGSGVTYIIAWDLEWFMMERIVQWMVRWQSSAQHAHRLESMFRQRQNGMRKIGMSILVIQMTNNCNWFSDYSIGHKLSQMEIWNLSIFTWDVLMLMSPCLMGVNLMWHTDHIKNTLWTHQNDRRYFTTSLAFYRATKPFIEVKV